MALDTLARHLLVELSGCDVHVLDDSEALRRALRRAAEAAGAHIVAEVFHPFAPHGVTGVVLLQESHFSIHTWPETGYAAVDFYTCGDTRPELAIESLAADVGAERADVLEIERGLSGDESRLATASKPPAS